MSNAPLQLAPGSGRLARRPGAVLFVPEAAGSEQLVSCFTQAASTAAAAQEVKDIVIEQDFTGPAFVLVQWDGAMVVTVFGDVEARTSSRAAPRLSGASSMGLVEHRPDPTQDFSVEGGDIDRIDPMTELTAGSVFAGGFAIQLPVGSAALPTSPSQPAVAVAPAADAAPLTPPPATSTTDDDLFGPPDGAMVAPAAPPAPAPISTADDDLFGPPDGAAPVAGAAPLTPPPATSTADDDLFGPPDGAAPAPGAAPPGGAPVPPSSFDEWSPADLLADDPTPAAPVAAVPPPAPAPVASQEVPAPAPPAPAEAQPMGEAASGPLVEARQCDCGMASPPTETACRSCSQPIGHIAPAVITRPCVAVLELADGSVIDVDTNLSIGRDPKPQPGFDGVVVDLPGVSRHHLDIRLDGWDLLVTDRSSKNGVMVAGEDGVPGVIEPEKAWLVRPGSTLYLGTNEVRVRVPTQGLF